MKTLLYIIMLFMMSFITYGKPFLSAKLEAEIFTNTSCIVKLYITNVSDKLLELEPYAYPGKEVYGSYYIVKDCENGEDIDYTGVHVSRVPLTRESYLGLKPGDTVIFKSELINVYNDLILNDKFKIQYSFPCFFYVDGSREITYEKLESNILCVSRKKTPKVEQHHQQ